MDQIKLFYEKNIICMPDTFWIDYNGGYWIGRSELYPSSVMTMDNREHQATESASIGTASGFQSNGIKVKDLNSLLIWIDDKFVRKLDQQSSTIYWIDEVIEFEDCFFQTTNNHIASAGSVTLLKGNNQLMFRFDTSQCDPEEVIKEIGIQGIYYQETEIMDEYELPVMNFLFGVDLYLTEDGEIKKCIEDDSRDALGFSFPVSSLEATIKKQIDESYKDGIWRLLLKGTTFIEVNAFKLTDISYETDNYYKLNLNGVEELGRLQQISDTTIQNYPFSTYNKNPKISNGITGQNQLGNFDGLDLISGALQVSLANNTVINYNTQMPMSLSSNYELLLVNSYNLTDLYNNMTTPTSQEVDVNITIYKNGSLVQNDRIDAVNIVYKEYNGSNEETKSKIYYKSGITEFVNIKKIDKLVVQSTDAIRQNIANNLFLYSTFQTYKGKFISKNKFYKSGNTITLNTEFGLLKGIITKAKIEITSSSIYEEIELLVMKTA